MNTLLLTVIPLLSLGGSMDEKDRGREPLPSGEITVTILFDNTAAQDGLEIGWGFAALLETPDHVILFDAGADGEVLLENFRLLGKDPMAVESVVISHAHGDHTGGLQALFDLGLRPKLYILSGFQAEMPEGTAELVEMVETSPGQQIVPGIRTTGRVGTAIPEQALMLDTQEGTVVLTGCAHPGVIEMLEKAQGLSSDPLYLVMGGFHLFQASQEQIQGILGGFRRLGVEQMGATHCTGDLAISTFQDAFCESFRPLGVGRVLSFLLSSSV